MFSAIARRWPIVAAVTLAAVAGAVLTLVLTSPAYEATATLQVPAASATSTTVRADDLAYTDRLANTYKHLLDLRDVRDQVARAAGASAPADVAVTVEPNTELLQVTGRADSAEAARRVADEAAALLVARAAKTARPAGEALAGADARQQDIEEDLGRLQTRLAGATDPAEQARLRQQIRLKELDYQALSTALAQLGTGDGAGARRLAVVDPAAAPSSPVSPSAKTVIGLALLLGLGAGAALALVVERRSPTAASVGEIERATGAEVLAVVPSATHAEPAGVFNGGSPHQEAFAIVRARLLAERGERARTILVTSATRGAGNSVIAANVAAALAAAQRSVALLDLDLRKPSQHLLLPGSHGMGAAALLRSDDPVEAMLERSLERAVRPNLDVLAGGVPAGDAAELLESPRLAELLALLGADHAFVIVDAPALVATSDAASIASKVDEALLVVGRPPVDYGRLRDTCNTLEALGVPHVHLVLNRGRAGIAGSLLGSRS